MYDNSYGAARIRNSESWRDTFREKYIKPYFQQLWESIWGDSFSVLDIWCWRWEVLPYLHNNVLYRWVDPTTKFFDYIYTRYWSKNNIQLLQWKLPNQLPERIPDDHDVVLVSQVIHTNPNIEESISVTFSKVKPWWRVIIITFKDSAEKSLRESFEEVYTENHTSIWWIVSLPSWVKVEAEVYFHKELVYEKSIMKYWTFEKKDLGPLFVLYECKKNIY